MKKTVLSAIAIIALTTSLSAEVKPYIGIGYNNFTIENFATTVEDSTGPGSYGNYRRPTVSFISATEDKGNAIALNGGIVLTNNRKINLFYFTGKENDSKVMKTTVIGISSDYSFNNFGTRKGWYYGAGFSNVTVEFDERSSYEASSESSTGLLFKGGLEYQTDNNLLFDIGYTFNFAMQDHKMKGKNSDETTNDAETWNTTTYVMPVFNISVSYLF
jgi:outer membrane protein W